jgi:dolichyl-phosphate beta-glucosyltransferase
LCDAQVRRVSDVQSSSLTLVIPCYNEARRLDLGAFRDALMQMPRLHLLFVDDGSTDATQHVLETLRLADVTRVAVLVLERNSGKAEAVRQGMLAACEQAATTISPICGFWDADLSAPLSELPLLLRALDTNPGVEWAWGIRLRSLGRSVKRSELRHYLGRAFATAASMSLGLPVYDAQCGAKLFRVSSLLREVLARPFLSRWVFDVEMLSRADALCMHAGERGVANLVVEQPLRVWHHRAGSNVKAHDFVRAMVDLWRIRRDRAHWLRG